MIISMYHSVYIYYDDVKEKCIIIIEDTFLSDLGL